MAFAERYLPIFSTKKSIDTKLLNLLGVQAFRAVSAQALYDVVPVPLDETIRGKVQDLCRDGIVVWPNFLSQQDFSRLQEEVLTVAAKSRDRFETFSHGPNTYQTAQLRLFNRQVLPATYGFYDDPRLNAMLQAAEKRPVAGYPDSGRKLEILTQGPLDGSVDPETCLHSDIFFSTHKAWLYLTDVEPEHGPLVYVKGSHRVTLKQLRYIYHESCHENHGSRRVTPAELEDLGLKESVMTCPKNTLVLANTCGYHCRRRGQPGSRRVSIHTSLRDNPFAVHKYLPALTGRLKSKTLTR